MAAKSNKAPAKKSAKNKPPSGKSAPSPARAVKVEVVSEAPDLMSPEVVMHISKVEKQIGLVGGMPDQILINTIEIYADQAAKYSQIAQKAGASALVYAWACGKLLNAAKENLGHGAFGKWRKEHLVPGVMSERTSARYMLLAAKCYDVRGLLQWGPTLRQAYVACGVLPDPAEGDQAEVEKPDVPKKQVLLASLSSLQKDLRLFEKNFQAFESSNEKLDAGEKTQLLLMKDEIKRFSDRILKLLP